MESDMKAVSDGRKTKPQVLGTALEGMKTLFISVRLQRPILCSLLCYVNNDSTVVQFLSVGDGKILFFVFCRQEHKRKSSWMRWVFSLKGRSLNLSFYIITLLNWNVYCHLSKLYNASMFTVATCHASFGCFVQHERQAAFSLAKYLILNRVEG